MTSRRAIRFGHSPDPDDAFMYYPLAEGLVDTEGLVFEQVLEDIESLNARALEGELETTAASVHAVAYLADIYAVLPCGASMGDGYGPIVVAREPLAHDRLLRATIAVPGVLTTAWLTLRLALGEVACRAVRFDRILDEVREGRAEAGLLIHEGQLTYARAGLHKVIDLGAWWRGRTGLPLPLGVNLVRRDLGGETMARVGRSLRRAIEWALANRRPALTYAASFARGLEPELTDRFVSMYVNEMTRDCGERGRAAIARLLEEGRRSGVITGAPSGPPAFVPV